ncbi:MAG: hypothetical protein R6T90_05965 [Dissulfuribacterales bacterium]
MRFHRNLSVVFFITALIFYLSFFLLTSCAQTSSSQEGSSQGFSETVTSSDSTNITYEFPDIPIPIELEKVEDKTMIIKTSGFQGGMLIYKGRITVVSLVEFFIKSMPSHGWVLEGTLNAKRSFLAFSKGGNSHCLIQLYEGSMGFKTEVQIWVSKPLGQ